LSGIIIDATLDFQLRCSTKLVMLQPGEKAIVRAFSRDISTAVDIIEIARRRSSPSLRIESVRIGTQEMINESNGVTTFRSVMEIIVRKAAS